MDGSEHFYELTGTAAVTLIGLLFVVITLGADRAKSGDERLLPTFLTPTFVHLGVVFLVALLALSPERDSLARPFGLVGIFGVVYSLVITRKAVGAEQTFDAWFFHGLVPIFCYAGIAAVAWPGWFVGERVYALLRAVSVALLLVGMRNAWAVAIDLAARRRR